MEKKERITIIPCAVTTPTEEDKELFPELDTPLISYLGYIPYYYINNPGEYLLFCLDMVF